MKILMTTWDGAGNTPPMASVATALVQRGHDLTVMGDPTLADDFAPSGVTFLPWAEAPARQTRGPEGDYIRDWEGDPMQGFGQLRDRLAVGAAGGFAAEILSEVERNRPDVIVTEMFLFGSLVAAESCGLPVVVLNPTIAVVPRPGVPPFGPGFLPASSPAEERLHAEVAEMGGQAWNAALPALNEARAELGLAPLGHVLEQYRVAAKTLLLTSEAFDFPGELPPGMKYVGPRLDDPAWIEEWAEPEGDDPLVLVSFSSDFQDQQKVLERTVRSFDGMAARALITTGWGVEPESLPAAANTTVVRSAPHCDVLAKAAAVVTHCGHGTVMKALAAGVPLVCIPQGRDQLDIAARVVHCGAGVRLDPGASETEIAAAIQAVLGDPEYREAARRMAKSIADEITSDRAVEEIESLAG
jgi:MGT family glycosyltransferase